MFVDAYRRLGRETGRRLVRGTPRRRWGTPRPRWGTPRPRWGEHHATGGEEWLGEFPADTAVHDEKLNGLRQILAAWDG